MKRILLVDDDTANCNATTAILQDLDCVVDIATDGNSALRRLRRTVPDGVLVGLNIPDMAESAFVAACHHEPRCSDVPVVVMAVTPRAAVDAIRMGARGCIRKPVDMGGLVAALQPLLHEDTPLRIATDRSRYATSTVRWTTYSASRNTLRLAVSSQRSAVSRAC